MASKDHLQEEPLAFKGMLIAAVGIMVVIAAVVFGFNYVNEQRRQRVIAEYDQSVTEFVAKNEEGVTQLFTQVMDTCQTEFTAANRSNNYQQSIECPAARSAFDALNKEALKDFSATAYIRVQNGRTQMLEASGRFHGSQEFTNTFRYNMRTDIQQYLLEAKEINRWQDFIYFLPSKEVITPVERDGQTLGYILLSVIEK